jgi:hypothetical protein
MLVNPSTTAMWALWLSDSIIVSKVPVSLSKAYTNKKWCKKRRYTKEKERERKKEREKREVEYGRASIAVWRKGDYCKNGIL